MQFPATLTSRLLIPLITIVLAGFLPAYAQPTATPQACLQPGRVEQIRKQLTAAAKPAPDPALMQELIASGNEIRVEEQKARFAPESDKKARSNYDAFIAGKRARVCEILNTVGWPTLSAVQTEASMYFMYIITKALPMKMQLEIYPVIVEADRVREIERNEIFAAYIDRLRLATGAKQAFGTQAYPRDGFLVLAPLEEPERVDELRKSFQMEPLSAYERRLERAQGMPLIRLVTEPRSLRSAHAGAPDPGLQGVPKSGVFPSDEGSVIKVDTAVVTLDVIIPAVVGTNTTGFGKQDFRVFENDKPVEIESFSRVDAPFDIVLLLDLSGSMSEKVGLIRKSTRRFIELKRPGDRVAVVAFSDDQNVISELEDDRAKLLERVKKIEGRGGSDVWDAIAFAHGMLDKNSGTGRRRAIVLMSDGVDNALHFSGRAGSSMSFADLVEMVQKGSTSIFPIYVDTESSNTFRGERNVYATARRTLDYIADQSAGNLYTAKKLDDLEGIYERVLKDVGTVYTLGFSPSDDEIRPGRWRRLRVELPAHPSVRLKHRPGYFPRPAEPKP